MSNTVVTASGAADQLVDWEKNITESGDSRVLRGKPDLSDLLFLLVLLAGAVYASFSTPIRWITTRKPFWSA